MVSHPTFLYPDSPKVGFHDSQLLCSWPEQCAGEDHIRDILSLWHYLDPNLQKHCLELDAKFKI